MGEGAEVTVAILRSSVWVTTPVDARATAALVWSAVAGGQFVGVW